ncbi:MAG: hypothetical protein QOF48_2525 [Verrucomicrobiota bacterium]|jgi:hypothetical protein
MADFQRMGRAFNGRPANLTHAINNLFNVEWGDVDVIGGCRDGLERPGGSAPPEIQAG